MAHAATLTGLAGDLVTAITGKAKHEASFAGLHDQTLKGLRDQSHARTNQFAVSAKLDGMVEKLEVLNREDLASALQSRLEELQAKSRWMPEMLSFLLELSDRPAEKTVLEDVELANGPAIDEKDLTWEDILAEDPLSDSEIWEDVERGYFSSGDDSLEENTDLTVSTQATWLGDEDGAAVARLHLVQCDDSLLSATKATRDSWKPVQSREKILPLSELIIIREILSMMHGLPTDLFHMDVFSGRISLARRASMATASSHSLYDVLNACVRNGTIINYLRRWDASSQDTPYLQSIQSEIHQHCEKFGRHLEQIEQRYLDWGTKTVVSAIRVQTEVHRAAELLIRLATLIKNASGDASPFALLDLLYEETTTSQMTDSPQTFQALASIFLVGLRTYLRPVAAWTKTGSLSTKDDGSFFILDSNHNCELGEFWHGHFSIRRRPDGTPSAPKCFVFFTQKIFALGKSRALMRRLGQERDDVSDGHAPLPFFDGILDNLRQDTLMPFTQLLHDRLALWIAEVSTDCTPQLQSAILHDHGLTKTTDALPYIYCSRDGIAFSAFAEALIARAPGMGCNNRPWSDQFLLTELAHNIFGGIPGVDADNVYVSATSNEEANTTLAVSTTVQNLAELEIRYKLPWPVQNVTRSSTPVLHSKVFVFLLQVYYASSLIQGHLFELRSGEARSGSASKAVLKLRQHLLCFTSLMQAYLTTTAHTLHQQMQDRMLAAEDIDAMAMVWAEHERRLETSLLLTERLGPVRDAIIRILEISELLANTSGSSSVAGLLDQYQRGMAFLVAGVRGVSRAGAESSLEILAERLESLGW